MERMGFELTENKKIIIFKENYNRVTCPILSIILKNHYNIGRTTIKNLLLMKKAM